MIKLHRLLLSLCITCVFPLQGFAEAPVVDDSENFAILDDQQAAVEQPVAKAQLDEYTDTGDEVALAHDNHDSDHTNDNAELLNKLQGLQQDIQELRGQLEVQAHDLKSLQQQQLAFYKDLDARLRPDATKPIQSAQSTPMEQPQELTLGPKVAAAATPAVPAVSSTQPASQPQEKQITAGVVNSSHSNPANEQISYLAAYELVKNKRFDDALVAMQAFIAQYPQGGYTANAQYWLGELYMVKNNYPKAIDHFETVLKQFPSSSKAAASTLKIGYALAASGKEREARLRLQQVLKNYPDTPTAQLAATKLESLGVS
ncbi:MULTISPECIES: tol-pal system protein YbgF [Legionella]|uniref:Cell division coordinator CpoB n=1 Tax=Legionella maceachernii TaxID=466 RepID=A0A0W0W011_9GAMM|nr:tol-pal system protein YbgF [Legionella maceachernii]KTD25601.1 outer membrane protein [Legionella maceachernii]SJZ57186.1 tol-pal system protein YbgF [Legionella maceachernii]SUP00580.1 tol-pal system protein YbgF [Legionella maceachernii]